MLPSALNIIVFIVTNLSFMQILIKISTDILNKIQAHNYILKLITSVKDTSLHRDQKLIFNIFLYVHNAMRNTHILYELHTVQ